MPQVCVRDCFRDNGVLSCTPDLRDATCDPDFHFLCVFELHGLVHVWAQVSPAPPPPPGCTCLTVRAFNFISAPLDVDMCD